MSLCILDFKMSVTFLLLKIDNRKIDIQQQKDRERQKLKTIEKRKTNEIEENTAIKKCKYREKESEGDKPNKNSIR